LEHDGLRVEPIGIAMTCPTWSPEYDQLAFSDHGNIHVYDVKRMTDQTIEMAFSLLSTPVWSPSGDHLAFAAQRLPGQGGLDIWLIEVSTYHPELVVDCVNSLSPDSSCSSPAWLPDGRLGYVRHAGYDPNAGPLSSIEVFDLESHEIEIVATELPIHKGWAPFGAEEQFYYDHYSTLSWSPDGSRVAFDGGSSYTDDNNIYVLDVATGDVSGALNGEMQVDTPVWLSNSHLLFRSIVRPEIWEEGSHTEAYNIAIVDTEAQDVMQLTSFKPIFGSGRNPIVSCPFWVPSNVRDEIVFP